MRALQTGLWVLVVIAALAAAAGFLVRSETEPGSSVPSAPVSVPIGGDFVLTDHTGQSFNSESQRGKHMLIYFGYSFCPDVCPLELAKMGAALTMLEDANVDTSRVQPLFITVDPVRDTPSALADYVPNFHDRLLGLTGSVEEIDTVRALYRIQARKVTVEGYAEDDYLMDHSSIIFLMDETGKLSRFFTSRDTPETLAEELRTLIDAGPAS